jgi:processive 1,2-diacylglycerol beta-glucosyltransferase
MRARSLEAWCAQHAQGHRYTTVRYQALEESAGIYRFGVNLYNWIQKKCPALHHLYFNFLEIFQVSASERTLLGKEKFIEKLVAEKPDVIVSVHAHTNHAFRAVARSTLPEVRFVTYCGEMHGGYGFSRHWVDPKADAFIGATPKICEAAQALGMPKQKILYGGFLLDPKFYQTPLEADQRARIMTDRFGLDPKRFTLLLSTGANGALNHFDFLKALDQSQLNLQVVALCGRNEQARQRIESNAGAWPNLTVRSLGYQEDMFTLMQCVDGIVARPGTGTTSEAILAACPLYFNAIGGIMPQEWITVKYLRSRGLSAALIKHPSDLVDAVAERVQSNTAQSEEVARILQIRPEPTPGAILQYLNGLTSSRSAG